MQWQGIGGIVFIILFAWIISSDRKAINLRLIIIGVCIQLSLALALIKFDFFRNCFYYVNKFVSSIEQATKSATGIVFGYLGGAQAPFEVSSPENSFILAFQALPLVIVISALSALCWHWKIIPLLIRFFSLLLQKAFDISGGAGLGCAANIFLGMVESPLVIRHCLQKMSKAELFMIMTCGMATVAGTVIVLYAHFLSSVMDDALTHVLTASIISAPAAVFIALIIKPVSKTTIESDVTIETPYRSSLDAITTGTSEGLKLILSIIAMLIVFIALIELVNYILALVPTEANEPLTLQRIFAFVFTPLVWLLGIPWAEAETAAMLMGIKTVINEFLAYIQMSQLPPDALSPRSKVIMAYALCGFANPGSLGIMIGGLCSICPERKKDILKVAPLSLASGTLAACMTAAIVGLIY